MVNGIAAAQWLLNYGWLENRGYCLYYVWLAYKAQGASTGRSAPTAYEGWNRSDGKHWGDRNPPAGAAVWWGRRYRDGNGDGDVVISLGNGRVAATDYPNWNVTGSCTIDEREQQIGREYLGWTSSIFDCPIDLGGASTGGSSSQFPARERYGADWVVAAQQKLIALGYDLGPDGADGFDGARTQAATGDVQKRVALDPDNVFGPDTNARVDLLLATKNGHRAFPLPAGYYFGPQDGPAESISGYHSYTPDLKAWQQRMADRGWTITADGLYGDESGDVAEAFQREKGYTVDRHIGPETWDGAWEAPVTPAGGGSTPSVPSAATPRTPVYPGASRAWDVPLAMARPAGAYIGWLIMHHQASTGDDEPYFKTKNSRGSCPTWQIKTSGEVVEFIPPGMEPASTGDADHWAVTVEFQNATGNVSGTDNVAGKDWAITDAQHEAAAKLAAWLSKQETIQGVPVRFTLDRAHLFGDRETTVKTGIQTRPTACPGPSLDMDRIVRRALELTKPPTPEPEPEPPILTPDAATFWQRLFEWLREFFKGAK